jgi:hypothetical protein
MRRLALQLATVTVALALTVPGVGAVPAVAQGGGSDRIGQPRSIGDEQLLTQFFDLLADQDLDGLAKYLSPAFVLLRSDGTVVRKREYLADPSTVNQIEVNDVGGTRAGEVRVIHAIITADAVIEGQPVQSTNSPRLATFAWNGKRWQMTSYANFAALD